MIDIYGKYTEYLALLGEENKPGLDDRLPGLIEEYLSERLSQLSPREVMVEVGVACFYTGGLLALCYPSLIVVGVDNFTEGEKARTRQVATFQVGILPNLQLVEANSVEASKTFKDNSIGLCFIDANHTYDSVLADIAAWRGKIKPSGWMAFHDVAFPSVRQAIDASLADGAFVLDCRADVPNGFEIWQKTGQ